MSSTSEQLPLPWSTTPSEPVDATDPGSAEPANSESRSQLQCLGADAVATALNGGAWLLTANGAQSVEWKRRLLLESGDGARQTPAVQRWSEWIRKLCEADADMPVALNRLQETALWERVIRQDLRNSSQSASSIRGLAKHASQAWSRMCEYGAYLSELDHAGEEAEALKRWVEALHLTLQEDAVLRDRAVAVDLQRSLPERIASIVNSGRIDLPSTILLSGFHHFTPLQSRILRAVADSGITIMQVEEGAGCATIEVVCCHDADSEVRFAADKVRELLTAQPNARIAVVISESVSDLTPLARYLNRALIPEQQYSPDDQRQAVMMPHARLSDAPMIEQLMFVLGLAGSRRLRFAELSRLLFSPWLSGFAEEQQQRVALELWLRRNNRHHVSTAALLASDRLQSMPQFARVLRELAHFKAGRNTAVAWVAEVNRLLQSVGLIPTGFESDERSSAEVGLINSFRDTLASLISLDALGEEISWSRFFSLLRTSCAQCTQQPDVCYPNVVVMPLVEVAGLHFDHLILLGFDEQAAPLAARPQPLLPLAMQQKYGMETATAALAFDYSHYLWRSLLRAASSIEISYAAQRDDQEHRLSAFAAGLPVRVSDPSTDETEAVMEVEIFSDTPAVPLSADDHPCGGTAILRDLSACPFRAFARHRLGVDELDSSTPGIEAKTKGSLLHLALEYIWRTLGTAEQLHRLDDQAERALILEAIDHAWQSCRSHVTEVLREVESQRMQGLLQEWLQQERSRPPFSVAALEQAWQLQLPQSAKNHIELYIKADRIDRDADGHRILIDYKSGQKQSVGRWIGARMAEPQLPLYAMAAVLGEGDAVSFARVRSGEMGFEGLSADEIGIEGILPCDGKRGRPDDWLELLDRWKQDIDALATEFVDGRCDVAPRDAESCRYCGLEALCRVEELGIDFSDIEEQP